MRTSVATGGSADLEQRKELAGVVFDSMDGIPAEAVAMVAVTLTLSARITGDDGLDGLARTLDYYALDVSTSGEVSGLTVLNMARVLARLDAAFVDRLDGVTVPPWPAIIRAVKELNAEHLTEATD